MKGLENLLQDFGIKASYKPDFEFLSTGCYALNWAISGKFKGGLPLGQVVEVYGDPATGKSLLLNHMYKEAQARGGFAWVDDTEYAFIPNFAVKVGVDLDRVIFPKTGTAPDCFGQHGKDQACGKCGHRSKCKKQKNKQATETVVSIDPSDTVEEHFTRVESLLQKVEAAGALDVPVVIALDSLGSLSTEHELGSDMATRDLFKAQLVRKGMRKVQGLIDRTHVLYIASNQSYDVIETGFSRGQKKKESGGGKGLKFHAFVRLQLDLLGKLYDDKNRTIGVRTKAYVAKNRVIPPYRSVILDVKFDSGIDRYSGLWEVLKTAGLLSGGPGGWYTIEGFKDKKWKQEEIITNYETIVETLDKLNLVTTGNAEASEEKDEDSNLE